MQNFHLSSIITLPLFIENIVPNRIFYPCILNEGSLQAGLYREPEFLRFHNHSLRPHTQHPLPDFIQSGHLETDFNTAIDELLDALALVPDLFADVTRPSRD